MSSSWMAFVLVGVVGSGVTTASCGARDEAQTPRAVAAGDRPEQETPGATGARVAPPSSRPVEPAEPPASADPEDGAETEAKPELDEPRAPDAATGESEPSGSKASPSPTALEKARGLSRSEVRERFGAPNRTRSGRWIYVLPTGACASIRRSYTLRFEDDRVVDVEIERQRTGQHCEPHPMP